MRLCVPLSTPDAPIALWLGPPDSSTNLTRLFRLTATFSPEIRRTKLFDSSREVPVELSSTLPQRHRRNSGGNTSDFLCHCSQHPTFLLQPPHPTTYTHKPPPPLLTQPLLLFCSLFLYPFFFQAVTKKKFGSNDFRSALENGVLLCE